MKIAAAFCLLLVSNVHAQTRVSGRVTGTNGQAVGGVHVWLRDSLNTQRFHAVSDSSGTFEISVPKDVLPARMWVNTDRIGYGAVSDVAVDITSSKPPFLELELSEEVVAVRPLNVVAQKRPSEFLDEFHRRAEQVKKGSGGYIINREELERGGQQSVARVISAVPGMQYLASRNGSNETIMSTRGQCAPRMYLDGAPLVVNNISMISAASLEGVEVYSGLGAGPAEYFDRSGCGVILMWSQRGKTATSVRYPIIGLAVVVSIVTILLTK